MFQAIQDSPVRLVDFGLYWSLKAETGCSDWSWWRVSWHPDTGHLVAYRNISRDDFEADVKHLATIAERALVDLVMCNWPDLMHEKDSIDQLTVRAQEAQETGTIDGRDRIEAMFHCTVKELMDGQVMEGRLSEDRLRWYLRRFLRARFANAGFLDENEDLPESVCASISAPVDSSPEMELRAVVWL